MDACDYEVVDVFTTRPYAGNPLAVVLDAERLSTEQMRLLAREFNYSETAFVLPPVAGGDYRVRIFTPARELPFAGHPSVGTAVTLVRLGRLRAGEVVQECGAGALPVTVDENAATLTGGAPTLGPALDPEPYLAAVRLRSDDLLGWPVREAGAGLPHVCLPLRADAVARARFDLAAARAHGIESLYVFSWDPERRLAHARLFFADIDGGEDPATGSAALGLGVWLVGSGVVPGEGETAFTVEQGAEIGRPSTLTCTVTAARGHVVRTTVTGHVAPVARGRIVVPTTP
ncbi:PhzF family phenazine biosynthesis protein [Thermasporomyces composti]|jgi:trans-2,3-dihydro-3-hydroxyanthranilate isomerase|uniref:Trans-2,3-dihydro-3-hydroxyanthranilate isomerase n=1 Tax=Thermasporomyces composti TaxID=696763 RepID=A0A3D9V1A2_THECX|nr:PhzF family phenazine biosynthesis protein [Thermasporomyces composti]REF35297.1 trans-2,3-dihydro-3-hydroxyanthranilate isomerase [Thermasporomyces composti]